MNARIFVTIGILLLGSLAHADVLLLDGIDAAGPAGGVRPARGMSMDRVEERFGAPVSRGGTVGEPPISRWEYTDFVVYFEHQHVIHAVTKPASQA